MHLFNKEILTEKSGFFFLEWFELEHRELNYFFPFDTGQFFLSRLSKSVIWCKHFEGMFRHIVVN